MKIVYVDGFKIRNTLDDDFGIINRNWGKINVFAPKFYIPEGEIWIDYRYKKETDFLLKMDIPLDEYWAEKKKQQKESKYINEIRGFLKKFCLSGPIPDLVIKQEIVEDINVKYIDGSLVRLYLDPEFFLGGHDLVYSYIPSKEIWLDFLMDPKELKYILLHEKTERKLIEEGKEYSLAHDFASVVDKEARVKDGFGVYPDYNNYSWDELSNEEIIKKYVIE